MRRAWATFWSIQVVGAAIALIGPFVIRSFWLGPMFALGGFFVLLPGSMAGPAIYESCFWGDLTLIQTMFAEMVLTVAFNVVLFWLVLRGSRTISMFFRHG